MGGSEKRVLLCRLQSIRNEGCLGVGPLLRKKEIGGALKEEKPRINAPYRAYTGVQDSVGSYRRRPGFKMCG